MTVSFSLNKEKVLYWLPWLVLVVGIACSLLLWNEEIHKGRQAALSHLLKESEEIQNHIHRKLASMEGLLATAQGVFVASEQVTRQEWARFYHAVQPEKQFRSLLGLAFIAHVPAGSGAWFENAMRQKVDPEFRITPAGQRADSMVITHLEPGKVVEGNIGLDLGSNPHLRERAAWSCNTGRPTLSDPVTLATFAGEKPLLVHLLPVYRSEDEPVTAEERQDALLGWIAAIYHADEFFPAAPPAGRWVGVEVDTAGKHPFNLYDSRNGKDSGMFLRESPLDVGGRHWRLRFSAASDSLGLLADISLLNLVSGVVLSLALWALAGVLVAGRSRALDMALRMTRALRESEERYRGIFQSVADPVLLLDDQGVILEANPASCTTFGYSQEEMNALVLTALIHPLHRVVFQHARTLLNTNQPFFTESLFLKRDGSVFPVEIRLSPALHQGHTAIIATVRDITARKQTDDRVLREKNRAEQYLAIAGTMIVALDVHGQVTMVNRKGCEVLEYETPELIGKNWFYSLMPEERGMEERQAFYGMLEENPSGLLDSEVQVVTRSKRIRLIAWRTTLVHGENGQVTGTLSSGEDITERRQAEDALKQAKQMAEQANVAKSEFLATMSHEIRTPLNAIIGMAEVVAEAVVSEDQRRYVTLLQKAGENLLDLINDILDLSKIESGRFELEHVGFRLRPAMNRILEIMVHHAVAKGLMLTMDIHAGVPDFLHGDSRRLRQVLMNLLGNAVKFTHQGAIRLTVRLDAGQPGGALLFQVADTGIGIPRDKLDLIFDMFTQADSTTTRQYGGTGLGLAICRRLVGLMGGRLWVESAPGKGSVFSFTAMFDLMDPAATGETQAIPAPEPAGGDLPHPALARREQDFPHPRGDKLAILIVEDAEDNVALLRAYLKSQPWNIFVAVNGREGVDRFMEQPFDIVLMDVQMPVMDGHAATRAIRDWEKAQGKPAVPIVAISAYAFEEDVRRSLDAGCSSHLTKPINKIKLLDEIRRHVDHRENLPFSHPEPL